LDTGDCLTEERLRVADLSGETKLLESPTMSLGGRNCLAHLRRKKCVLPFLTPPLKYCKSTKIALKVKGQGQICQLLFDLQDQGYITVRNYIKIRKYMHPKMLK